MGQMLDVARLGYTALEMLRAVAETGSFTAAGARLGYSQPAVSQHIRRVESYLGVPVLIRIGQRYELTEVGHVLVRQSQRALDELREANREISSLVGVEAGHVRLTVFRSMCASFVPQALAKLRQEHPGVTLSLSQEHPDTALEHLEEGQSDIVTVFGYEEDPEERRIGERYVDDAGRLRVHLGVDPMMVALPANDPLVDSERLSLVNLADRAWIAGMNIDYLQRRCAEAGYQARVVYTVDDFLAAHGLVAAGLGVALFPGICADSVSRGGVVMKFLESELTREIEAVLNPRTFHIPAAAVTIDSLITEAQQFKEQMRLAHR